MCVQPRGVLFLLVCLLGLGAYAQTSVNGGHGSIKSTSLSYHYSIGQMFTQQFGSGSTVISGIQVPSEYNTTTGIDESISLLSSLKAYPNPCLGILNLSGIPVEWVGEELTLVDMLGKIQVKAKLQKDFQQLDLSGLQTGVYTLFLSGDNKQQVITIIQKQ